MSWLTTRWYFPASIALLIVGAVAFGLHPKSEPEHVVWVTEVRPVEPNVWLVPAVAVAQRPGGDYVMRVNHLRAQRLAVKIVGRQESNLAVHVEGLREGDLVVVSPGNIQPEGDLAPVGGVSDRRLIAQVLAAGIEAAQSRDLAQSVRFISPDYQDRWGFDRQKLAAFLKRAYKEFDSPRVELAESPLIEVQGDRAKALAGLRLTAAYRGRRNYLLGDDQAPNQIRVDLARTARGWKMDRLSGMRILGFEEDFILVLGAEVGVTLNDEEKKGRDANCMRCKQRMEERFLGDH